MKKNSSLLLAFALVLSLLLSGCGQTSAVVSPSEDDAPPVSEPAAGTKELSGEENGASDKSEEPSDEDTTAEDASAGEESKPADTEAVPKSNEEASPKPEAVPAEPEAPEAAPKTPAPAPTSAPETTPESAPTTEPAPTESAPAPEPAPAPESAPDPAPEETPASNTTLSGTDLTLRFGGGEEFSIHMYDNPTANKIAEYVGTASWQLPINHFDDYDGWESFQYYDIPSRYDIPDGSQSVTSEKAGVVYYSHPNRIILFYQDANISHEYTPVGYIDFSQSLMDAVENNPVVEGWGNKLVFIQP